MGSTRPRNVKYRQAEPTCNLISRMAKMYPADKLSAETPGRRESAETQSCLSRASPRLDIIGLGMWIGSIMLFNVWGLIWPNQQKILGLVSASDEQKAKARKVASLASRTNFALSIPLVLCMGSAIHGLPF